MTLYTHLTYFCGQSMTLPMKLETERLILKPWSLHDLPIFTKLHTNPIVMADQGGPISKQQSKEKLERYVSNYEIFGYSRWRVALKSGEVIGYCGVSPVRRQHPLGHHEEIGWRLFPEAWGHGYATEAAITSLKAFFTHNDIQTVYAYTAADNVRSQRVMKKIGLIRDDLLDFIEPYGQTGEWKGLVWKANRQNFTFDQ